jgi:hypothetical protein
VIPEGRKGKIVEEHNHWVAKIKEIRARSDSTDVHEKSFPPSIDRSH